MGERLTVQFARGSRQREGGYGPHERAPPRPRRTPHRMQITNLPQDTSWQVCFPPLLPLFRIPWIPLLPYIPSGSLGFLRDRITGSIVG
jgi:hypothetical protein